MVLAFEEVDPGMRERCDADTAGRSPAAGCREPVYTSRQDGSSSSKVGAPPLCRSPFEPAPTLAPGKGVGPVVCVSVSTFGLSLRWRSGRGISLIVQEAPRA